MGSLLLRLVPLVGMPNKDVSKNREGDGSLALGGRRAAIGWMMERMHGQGGVYGGGVFLFWGGKLSDKKTTKIK